MRDFKKLLNDLSDELGIETAMPNEIVRTFRKQLGLTLRDVEEITGIQESNLSKVENGKIEITQHYAEVFAAAFGLNPLVFLYPNGEFKKSKELLAIERRGRKLIGRAKKKTAG
jgi:transcriptional regulator with XRE-family HTH domain